MKALKRTETIKNIRTWEEESGFLDFLSVIPGEVELFNKHFDFGINDSASHPSGIDGDAELPLKSGFVLMRDNPLLPEVTYCLYSLLINRELYGYIGILDHDSITTLKQLKPIKDFKKGKVVLYEWLSQLVRVSCEKRMP
jgi:hypothetical protein